MTHLVKIGMVKVHGLWKFGETAVLDKLAPVADLAARLYLARVFFRSGWNKVTDWESTLYLFREEYHAPFLPPEIAATLGAGGEVGFSLLLATGLFTRFAASGLFVLNIVAVVSYYDSLKDSPAALQDHLEWGILLAVLLTTQVKQLTADHVILRRFL
jgi:putative oxidoreductase